MSNKIALDALKFYADPGDYKAPFTGGMGKLYYDCGETARAAIAALQAEPQPSAHGPEEIFLQLHGDCLPHETDLPVVYTDDSVTWCWHRIHDSDVRYIRADLAALPATPPKD